MDCLRYIFKVEIVDTYKKNWKEILLVVAKDISEANSLALEESETDDPMIRSIQVINVETRSDSNVFEEI